MRKPLFILIALAAIAAFGLAGNAYWKDRQAEEALKIAAKSISVRIDNIATNTAGETNITIGEFSRMASENVQEIEKTILEIKTAEAIHKSRNIATVEKYGLSANEFLRSMQHYLRETVAYNSSKEDAERYIAELKETSSVENKYAWDRLIKSAKASADNMQKHSNGISESSKEAVDNIKKLKSISSEIGLAFGREAQASDEALDKALYRMSKQIGKSAGSPDA